MSSMAKPVILAGVIFMTTMGIRQTVGLFALPILAQGGVSLVELSLAFAVGQLVWGLCQPLIGVWIDKGDPFKALCLGALCLALGQVATIWATTPAGLMLTQGLVSPAGAAAGSFSVLMGIVAARVAAEKRSVAGGFVNASGSLGQFIFAPLVQKVMNLYDYSASLALLGGCALLTIMPAWLLCRMKKGGAVPPEREDDKERSLPRAGLGEQIHLALRDKSYLLLNAGFFTCGFHVAFLTTHLPGEAALSGHGPSVAAAGISLIGFCNIAGSLAVGFMGKRLRQKTILAGVYALRGLILLAYTLSARTETEFYLFSCAIGVTWLATVSPTAVLTAKLFGPRHLATLLGLIFFSHQVGAFLGAWLGGMAARRTGNLDVMFMADAILALFAALVNLPIREQLVSCRGL